MSTPTRDLIEEQRHMAMEIQSFLYEGKSHLKQFQPHTKQEYQQFLDRMHTRLWEKYHDAEKEILGY